MGDKEERRGEEREKGVKEVLMGGLKCGCCKRFGSGWGSGSETLL